MKFIPSKCISCGKYEYARENDYTNDYLIIMEYLPSEIELTIRKTDFPFFIKIIIDGSATISNSTTVQPKTFFKYNV